MTPISLPSLVAGAPVGVGPEPVDVFIASGGTTALVANFQTSAVTPISLPGLVPAPADRHGGKSHRNRRVCRRPPSM